MAGAPLGAAGTQSAAGAVAIAGAGPAPTLQPKSPGCGLPAPSSERTLQAAGSTTTYLVDYAENYDPNHPYPLVVTLRGSDVTAAAFRRYLDLVSVVGADGIVVTLECGDGATNWDALRDLPLFDALLTRLLGEYCIDPERVFVVGHASGAMFASSVVCAHSGVLRGLGSLSGAAPTGTCDSNLAVWITQGNADSTVALGRSNRDFWARRNHCDADISTPVDPAPCVAYQGCDSGFPVHYCEYDGNLNLPSFAAEGVWTFFQAL